jgi:hypothetical protein
LEHCILKKLMKRVRKDPHDSARNDDTASGTVTECTNFHWANKDWSIRPVDFRSGGEQERQLVHGRDARLNRRDARLGSLARDWNEPNVVDVSPYTDNPALWSVQIEPLDL